MTSPQNIHNLFDLASQAMEFMLTLSEVCIPPATLDFSGTGPAFVIPKIYRVDTQKAPKALADLLTIECLRHLSLSELMTALSLFVNVTNKYSNAVRIRLRESNYRSGFFYPTTNVLDKVWRV